jgi:hypothetical protein
MILRNFKEAAWSREKKEKKKKRKEEGIFTNLLG